MHLLTREDLKTLTETRPGWHVSMFLPMQRAGAETQQNPIRCKNLLRQAEERLRATDLRASEAEALLQPVQQLVAQYDFWQHQSDGLALFVAPQLFRTYRLPLAFAELVVVTHRFHIKPLLPLLCGDGRFYLLALSQNTVRLLQCSRDRVMEIDVEDMPTSLADALRYDEPQKQLQFHTGTQDVTGRRAAMFHGHGVGTDDAKARLVEYFRQVDRALHPVLRDERAPLVLAGVDYLLPLYKEVTSYAHALDQGLTGILTRSALKSSTPRPGHSSSHSSVKEQEEAVAHYRRYAGTARAANDVKTVVPAAYAGRVERLFVAVGVQQWGTFDPDTQTVQLQQEAAPDAEDLLDFAALHTFLQGGTVYAVAPEDMPEHTPIAAVFRY